MSRPIFACRACGNSPLLKYSDVHQCTLYKCKGCDYVQVGSIPSSSELADIYSENYFTNEKYVDDLAAKREFYRRLGLIRLCSSDSSINILDYGCASGDFVSGVSSYYQVKGVDFSDDAIKLAKHKYPLLKDGFFKVEDLSILDSNFDIVTMWDVIEHLADPQAVLQEINSFLPQGGFLVISTPNIGSFVARLMGNRWAFMTPPEHLGFFNKKSLTLLLRRYGYDVVKWKSVGKSVNLSFLAYKLNRVFPKLIPQKIVRWVSGSCVGKLCVYIPTGDIQYLICRKTL